MVVTKLPYEKIGHMTEEERESYAKTWLYMHKAKSEWGKKLCIKGKRRAG